MASRSLYQGLPRAAVWDKAPFIPINALHIFFDYGKPNQTSNVLDPLPKIAERRAPVHTVFVRVNVALDLAGIRH
jgi:hypothetical protein